MLPELRRLTESSVVVVSTVIVLDGEFEEESSPLTVVEPERRISPEESAVTLPRIIVEPRVMREPPDWMVMEPVTMAESSVHAPPEIRMSGKVPVREPEHKVCERDER